MRFVLHLLAFREGLQGISKLQECLEARGELIDTGGYAQLALAGILGDDVLEFHEDGSR